MTSIKYTSIKIHSLRESSGFFVGTNVQKGRKSDSIINEGFGRITGSNNNIRKNSASLEKNR